MFFVCLCVPYVHVHVCVYVTADIHAHMVCATWWVCRPEIDTRWFSQSLSLSTDKNRLIALLFFTRIALKGKAGSQEYSAWHFLPTRGKIWRLLPIHIGRSTTHTDASSSQTPWVTDSHDHDGHNSCNDSLSRWSGGKLPHFPCTPDSEILPRVGDSFPNVGHRSWLGAGPLAAQRQARFVPLFVWSFGFNL